MTALPRMVPVSVADYLAGEVDGDVKHEYVGGTVHAMSGGTNRHNAIATNTAVAFGNALRGKPCRPFNSDTKVRIELVDHVRFYYPDAMVVCDRNAADQTYQERPVVVVEVLSESTRRIDLEEKRDAYLTIPSLKLLLYIEQEFPCVAVYRRKTEGGFTHEIHADPKTVIAMPEIEVEIPVCEFYRDA